MDKLLDELAYIRQRLKQFFATYSTYVHIAVKWAVAFAALRAVNEYFPGRPFLLRIIVVIAAAFAACALPWGYISLFVAVWLLTQLSALSLEATAFLLVLLLIVALLRYLLLPGGGIILVLMPLAFLLKIPYAVPLLVGLTAGVGGFVSVGSGVVLYYTLQLIFRSLPALTDAEASSLVDRLLLLAEGFLKNGPMIAVTACFCLVTLLVYVIRRMSVPYAPVIAADTGAVLCPLTVWAGFRMMGRADWPANIIWGSLAALGMALVFCALYSQLDYKKTEYVQFEDDEYYYYVKAVPKVVPSERLLRETEERTEDTGPKSRQRAVSRGASKRKPPETAGKE